jgi:hypothetical protein
VALRTWHGKEHIIAPVLGAALGCRGVPPVKLFVQRRGPKRLPPN